MPVFQIALLEDDGKRIEEMTACLRERFPDYSLEVFDNAPDMIEWLSLHLEESNLICLDHDLGPNRLRDGEIFDPGIGRDVVNFLASRTPSCPVVIHSTNSMAVTGMQMALDDAGWRHFRVVPYCDLEWVREAWIVEVAKILRKDK
jgi:hypothetical protein